MDHRQFDRLSRAFAERTTRRQAMRQVGAGGVLGGLGVALGVKTLAAQAPVQTCALPIYAEVYVGPWLGMTYQGTFSLDIGSDGAVDNGSLETLDGASYPLVGTAAGRALDLRVDLGNEQLLTFTGTSELDFDLCQGAAAGSFSGPEMGNMGTWTTVDGMTAESSDSGVTPPAISTPGSCPDFACLEPQVPNSETCACDCPDGGTICGAGCCGAGQECADPSTSTCACAAACSEVEYLDEISCTCVAYCPEADCTLAETLNIDTCECEGLPICPAGTVACGSVCADLDEDAEHCGSCGHACPVMPTSDDSEKPSLCVAGDCCLDIDHLCAGDGDCCSGSCDFISGGLRVCT